MLSTASKINSTRTYFDKEQNVDRLKKERINGEEITRQDLLFVVLHEMSPTHGAFALRYRRNTVSRQDIANRLVTDNVSQLTQFALKAIIAPT